LNCSKLIQEKPRRDAALRWFPEESSRVHPGGGNPFQTVPFRLKPPKSRLSWQTGGKEIEQGVGCSCSCQRTRDRGKIATMTTIEIRASALNLPAPERAALAHDLIASLDAEDVDPRADTLWAAEIERRAREVADGKVALIDADEVHAEIAQRLRARTGR
jgi:putative addiction module component (TIGR02574 family)